MGRKKKKTRSTFSDNDTPLYIFGIDELIEKLEGCEEQIKYAVPVFIERQAQPFYNALYKFMAPRTRHHTNGKPNTIDFLGQWLNVSRDKTKYRYKVGFELINGELAGLPALFLDLGTRPHNVTREAFGRAGKVKAPHIEPTYFVYFARKAAEQAMMRDAPALLDEILKEVKK